jgi:hypothetical protein
MKIVWLAHQLASSNYGQFNTAIQPNPAEVYIGNSVHYFQEYSPGLSC